MKCGWLLGCPQEGPEELCGYHSKIVSGLLDPPRRVGFENLWELDVSRSSVLGALRAHGASADVIERAETLFEPNRPKPWARGSGIGVKLGRTHSA